MRIGLLYALTFSLAISCNNEDPINAPVQQSNGVTILERDKGINGTKLTDMDFPDNAGYISFWEFEPGEFEILVSHHMDKGDVKGSILAADKIQKLVKQKVSLIEIYKEVNPNPRDEEISLLRKASQRQAQYELRAAIENTLLDAPVAIDREERDNSSARTLACAPDYYNNNWDADWFVNTFSQPRDIIKLNQMQPSYYPDNQPGIPDLIVDPDQNGYLDYKSYAAIAFAASFDSGVRWRCYKPSSQLMLDLVIPARYYQSWSSNSKGKRKIQFYVRELGDGLECGRGHFTLRWN